MGSGETVNLGGIVLWFLGGAMERRGVHFLFWGGK